MGEGWKRAVAAAKATQKPGSQSAPRRKGVRSWAFNVAGVTFRPQAALGFVRMAKECPPTMKLSPEPDNPHDSNAVRVEGIVQGWCCRSATPEHDTGEMHCPVHGDAVRVPRVHQCGYVPREFAPWVGALLKQGRIVEVKLAGAGTLARDPDVPWLRVRMVYRA